MYYFIDKLAFNQFLVSHYRASVRIGAFFEEPDALILNKKKLNFAIASHKK